jgi:hypothetical protein
MAKTITNLVSSFRTGWCSFWHDNLSWPVNGTYYCRTCLEVYPVKWANRLPQPVPEQPARISRWKAAETHT